MVKLHTLFYTGIFLIAFLFVQPVQGENINERVYIQTDKHTYLAGELMWFKMISIDHTGKPISLSKVGYVEILNENSPEVQTKIELKQGVGSGCITLPTSLPTGNYRLVGYTRYMQNEGENSFFEKKVPVFNAFVADQAVTFSEENILVSPTTDGNNTHNSDLTDRTHYPKRMMGEVRLNDLPSDIHTLSVSITGKDILPDQTNMNNWLVDIKKKGSNTFSYKGILPECEGHIVSGKLIDSRTNQLSKNKDITPLLGFVGDQTRIFGGQIADNSEVIFYTKGISGTKELVSTTIASDNAPYRIDISSPFADHTFKKIDKIAINTSINEEILKRSVGLQVLYNYMGDTLLLKEKTEGYFHYSPNRTYLLEEYTRFTTMEEVIIEFIPSLRFRTINGKRVLSSLTEDGRNYATGNTLALLDGIPIVDHDVIFKYNPYLIHKIDVYRSRFVFGGNMFIGIVSFQTKENKYPSLSLDANISQLIDYEGPQAPSVFYMPVYETEEQKNSRIPDYRHTLLWEPHIKIENGKTVSIPFSTSDVAGEYTVTIEGLTENGDCFHETQIIYVE